MMVTVTFPKSTVPTVISIEELVTQCGQINIINLKIVVHCMKVLTLTSDCHILKLVFFLKINLRR